MYENFFGLQQRPFTAASAADDFVRISPMQDALDSLVHCVTQGRGIAVLTAPPGLGKTMLCKRLALLLRQNYRSLFVNAGSAENRLGLLQAILFELNMGYVGLTEQEARLKLLQAARDIRREVHGFLLIIDDAQRLSPRLLEELRTLSEYAPEGETLINVVLSGTFELEEILTDPALNEFNQRIGLQLCLSPLSLEDSARYISERIRMSGEPNVLNVVQEDALEAICRASDGNLRCLSQLMDQACLLAFANEERPIQRSTVRAALENLKELPLHWNEIPDRVELEAEDDDWAVGLFDDEESEVRPARRPQMLHVEQETDEFPIPEFLREQSQDMSSQLEDGTSIHTESESFQSGEAGKPMQTEAEKDVPEFAVFEVGAGLDDDSVESGVNPRVALEELYNEMEQIQVYEFPQGASREYPAWDAASSSPMVETPVLDRYTLLDRMYELPDDRRAQIDLDALKGLPRDRLPKEPVRPEPSRPREIPEQDLLELVQSIRQEIQERLPRQDFSHEHRGPYQPQIIATPQATAARKTASQEAPVEEKKSSPPSATRRFEQLFTRLRLRRQKAESDQKIRD